jgi:hypothetical protein
MSASAARSVGANLASSSTAPTRSVRFGAVGCAGVVDEVVAACERVVVARGEAVVVVVGAERVRVAVDAVVVVATVPVPVVAGAGVALECPHPANTQAKPTRSAIASGVRATST